MRMIPTIYKQEGDGGDNNLRMGGDAKVQINKEENFIIRRMQQTSKRP